MYLTYVLNAIIFSFGNIFFLIKLYVPVLYKEDNVL